ncbi:hypothetical protein RCL1_006124 [Eukaryota sp. TZLM3-RCL]
MSSRFSDGTDRPRALSLTDSAPSSPRYLRSPLTTSITAGDHPVTSSGRLPRLSLNTSDISSPTASVPIKCASPRSFRVNNLSQNARSIERYPSPSSPSSPSSNNRLKVLLTVPFPREVVHHLRISCPNATIIAVSEHITDPVERESELKRLALGCSIIVGIPSTTPYSVVLAALPSLKLFQTPFAGVEDVLSLLSPFQDVPIANNHGNCRAVAEHAVSMLWALKSRLVDYHNAIVGGKWLELTGASTGETPREVPQFESIKMMGSKVGILGFGHIGSHIATIMKSLNCKVSVCKRTASGIKQDGITVFTLSQLDEFLSDIDSLFLALPLTKESRSLIGSRQLKILGKGKFVVNISRGHIIQEEALFEALQSGHLGGFATDVFWNESNPIISRDDDVIQSFPFSLPFHTLSNVLFSPHRADSPCWSVDYFDDIVRNINSFSNNNNKCVLNLINRDSAY